MAGSVDLYTNGTTNTNNIVAPPICVGGAATFSDDLFPHLGCGFDQQLRGEALKAPLDLRQECRDQALFTRAHLHTCTLLQRVQVRGSAAEEGRSGPGAKGVWPNSGAAGTSAWRGEC